MNDGREITPDEMSKPSPITFIDSIICAPEIKIIRIIFFFKNTIGCGYLYMVVFVFIISSDSKVHVSNTITPTDKIFLKFLQIKI